MASWNMTLLDALSGTKVNQLVIKCGCGHILIHRADGWIAHCPRCGLKMSTSMLRGEYQRRCDRMSMERIKENQKAATELLEKIHNSHQKSIDDLPADGAIPCGREIKEGVFFDCEDGEEPKYNPKIFACVVCDWAQVCKEFG